MTEKKLLEERYSFEAFEQAFPDLFTNVYCGFDLPAGWGPIVWDLCLKIQALEEKAKQDPEYCLVKVAQVKEKYGGLRFYVDGGNKDIDGIINFTEKMSFRVCMHCGTTVDVSRKGSGWIVTFCDTCYTEQKQSAY